MTMTNANLLLDDAQAAAWLKAMDQRARRHVMTVDGGAEVVWRQFGEGEPLVLIHGGHGSWLHWARNIDVLSGRFSLLIPNLPGYGDSSTPQFDDLSSLVEVTLASLEQLIGPDTTFNLCGFSFGGLVSAHIAARRPDSVRRLALLGPGGHGGTRRPRGTLINWKRALDDAELLAAMRHNLWVHMLYGDGQIDGLALRIHTQACVDTRFRSRGISQVGGLPGALEGYTGDTLFIWGENEVTCTPDALLHKLVEGHPRRFGRVIPSVGHWVQYEAPEVLNAMLLRWFGDGQVI